MKLILSIGLVLVAALGCSGKETCARGDWCACSDANDCNHHCDGDGNGCRLFCYDTKRCASVCGKECYFECHDATDCLANCGDSCTINCNNSVSCGTSCGANCNYSCWSTQSCSVQAGPGSMIACNDAASCVVECLGDCHVLCADQVDHCEVTCPQGVSPISCPYGMIACGPC